MTVPNEPLAEARRVEENARRIERWNRWGPFLSERAWGTVREDYSPYGTAWEFLPHDHARSKAYRWNEDGLAGICDRHQYICFAVALWNGRDPLLKERLFGLTGNEGNHGEDVKEYYFYLDCTPTHSYMKYLYKYPQAEFPYRRLVEENRRRSRGDLEFELIDTGVFDQDRYWDVFVEYAKESPEELLIRIQAVNRGPEPAELTVLPTLWFRNTWSWGLDVRRPRMSAAGKDGGAASAIELRHDYYGYRRLLCNEGPPLLFTENETNAWKLYGQGPVSAGPGRGGENIGQGPVSAGPGRAGENILDEGPSYPKDAINDYIVHGQKDAVNPERIGSKAAAHYVRTVPAGGTWTIQLRFSESSEEAGFGGSFDGIFEERRREADEFYASVTPGLSEQERLVQRQAFAGMLWSKQFYHYDVSRWLKGDPQSTPPPAPRLKGRNSEWGHLYNADVVSMPDKWEYPWYASWDLAFHCIPLAMVDPTFAKEQLILLLREWYMHPNGQLPAYEWALGDVNPPVHAWAAWRVYKMEKKRRGVGDRLFLERVFHKLLLNFTWWVNRKDTEGNNIFQGGFLGLDNIGVFDRSKPLPTGGHIEQSDATSWMGMYCLNMLTIALELAKDDRAYEDVASKFFEHFVYICRAMNHIGEEQIELWDRQDGFFYDVLHLPDGRNVPMKIRSMVGLIPLFAVETLDSETIDALPRFKHRLQWFLENRPDFAHHLETDFTDTSVRRFLSLVNRHRLRNVLGYMLDETEFLSPYGVRALSRYHREHPYVFFMNETQYRVDYEPAESSTWLFGGNSNWRGPVWFPVNYLILESLQKFHYYLGDGYTVECPTGSGRMMTLDEVATELARRLSRIFLPGPDGRRPVFGGTERFQRDPHWRDLIPFYEYFHGDNGAGIGASHQTGWTGLVAKCLDILARRSFEHGERSGGSG